MGRQLTGATQIHECVSFFREFSLLVLGSNHIQIHNLNTVRILGVDRITVVGWGVTLCTGVLGSDVLG